MGLTVADLRQHIEERQAKTQKAERIELSRGFYVRAEAGAILIIANESAPDDYAICGFVETTPQGDRWIIYRVWYDELVAAFGGLPDRLVMDEEAA